jgi:hypothetical protein
VDSCKRPRSLLIALAVGSVALLGIAFRQPALGANGINRGSVAGTLAVEGGPAPGTARTLITGTIDLSARGKRIATIHVPVSGTFRMQVPVGKYEVTATTPRIQQVNPDGKHAITPCSTAGPPVIVTFGKAKTVNVTCFVP